MHWRKGFTCLLSSFYQIGQKASEAFNPYESYPQLLENLLVHEKRDFDTIEGLVALKEKIEGLGIRHLFRYSGTENKIRLLLEGKDEEQLEEIMEECIKFFEGVLF